MTPMTHALLIKSLDGLTARAAATAENIANVNTPNYRPLRVTFEGALAAAAGAGDPKAVAAVEPKLQQAGEAGGLRLDLELATAASTAMRYAALIEISNRHTEIGRTGLSSEN
jgi:flagellar basal-body rod protein FlgB